MYDDEEALMPKARRILRVHSSMPDIKQEFNTSSKFRMRNELETLGLETAVKYSRHGKSVMLGYNTEEKGS